MRLNEAETAAQKSVMPTSTSMQNANAAEIEKAKTQNVKSPDRKWFIHRVVQQLIPSLSAQVVMAKQQEAEMQQQELEAQQQAAEQGQQGAEPGQEEAQQQENPEQSA
jgi:hypothetical protein